MGGNSGSAGTETSLPAGSEPGAEAVFLCGPRSGRLRERLGRLDRNPGGLARRSRRALIGEATAEIPTPAVRGGSMARTVVVAGRCVAPTALAARTAIVPRRPIFAGCATFVARAPIFAEGARAAVAPAILSEAALPASGALTSAMPTARTTAVRVAVPVAVSATVSPAGRSRERRPPSILAWTFLSGAIVARALLHRRRTAAVVGISRSTLVRVGVLLRSAHLGRGTVSGLSSLPTATPAASTAATTAAPTRVSGAPRGGTIGTFAGSGRFVRATRFARALLHLGLGRPLLRGSRGISEPTLRRGGLRTGLDLEVVGGNGVGEEERLPVVEVDPLLPGLEGVHLDQYRILRRAHGGVEGVLGCEREVQETPAARAQAEALGALGVVA